MKYIILPLYHKYNHRKMLEEILTKKAISNSSIAKVTRTDQ